MGIRRRILDLLLEEKNNGYTKKQSSNMAEIARKVGCSASSVRRHTEGLLYDGLIKSNKQGSYRRWWIKDGITIKEEDKILEWEKLEKHAGNQN